MLQGQGSLTVQLHKEPQEYAQGLGTVLLHTLELNTHCQHIYRIQVLLLCPVKFNYLLAQLEHYGHPQEQKEAFSSARASFHERCGIWLSFVQILFVSFLYLGTNA